MIKKNVFASLVGIFLMFFLTVGFHQVLAEEPDAEMILKKMKEVFEPSVTTTRMVTFTLKDKDRKAAQWVAREARKKLPHGKKSLLVMLEPMQSAGTARLINEKEGQTTAMFLYIPAMDRIRKIYPIYAYDTFLNTDFTFSDLGFVDIIGKNRLAGTEQFKGKTAYRVETIPKQDWYYSRIETWIDTTTYLPIQRDFYDRAGRLWKSMCFEEAAVINEIPTPLLVRMVDHQNETSTEYRISELCYGTNVPDEVFNLSNLPEALNASFCQVK
jgi:hypothetical protein